MTLWNVLWWASKAMKLSFEQHWVIIHVLPWEGKLFSSLEMKESKSIHCQWFPHTSPHEIIAHLAPVAGEYGRLDSPWRVRSHLETSGQPKAGTVTITRPQSLWAQTHWQHDKKREGRDYTGKAIGLRWSRLFFINRDKDETREKNSLSYRGLSFLLQEASAFQWTESLAKLVKYFRKECVLNWKLKVQSKKEVLKGNK